MPFSQTLIGVLLKDDLLRQAKLGKDIGSRNKKRLDYISRFFIYSPQNCGVYTVE